MENFVLFYKYVKILLTYFNHTKTKYKRIKFKLKNFNKQVSRVCVCVL